MGCLKIHQPRSLDAIGVCVDSALGLTGDPVLEVFPTQANSGLEWATQQSGYFFGANRDFRKVL